MAKRTRRRTCRNCKDLFISDHRNREKQRYCSKAPCRAASKKASNARWRNRKENRDYISGPGEVARVQQWRRDNPGYSKKRPLNKKPLQDHLNAKKSEKREDKPQLTSTALQDDLSLQSPVIIGLIANLTGNTLQDDIACTINRMRQLGQDILSCSTQPNGGSYDDKTSLRPATHPQGAGTIQLGGSPSCP